MPDNKKKSTNIDKENNDKMKIMNDAEEQKRNYRGAYNILKSGNEQKQDSLGYYFNNLSDPMQKALQKRISKKG